MNAKERVTIAMRNGTPDRVPFLPQICHPHAIRVLGKDFEETIIKCLRDPFLINKLDLECARMYGVDGLRIWIPSEPIDNFQNDGERIWQIDEQTGEKIGRVDIEGGGGVMPLEEVPLINSIEELEKIRVTPAKELLASEGFIHVKEIIDEIGDELFTIVPPTSVDFQYVTLQRGKQQAMMDIMENPELVKAIIDKGVDIAIQESIALAQIGVDALYLGDTFGGLIGPSLFEEFDVPACKRFVNGIKEYDIITYMHICGNSTGLFELMADTGVNCIEPLDPLGGVSVADAKKRVGQRVALMGGISTVLLAQGSLEEVIEDCKRCLDEGAPGGGYILASGDMLPTETSKEKVEAMGQAAKNYIY